jgi:hypothetical protein
MSCPATCVLSLATIASSTCRSACKVNTLCNYMQQSWDCPLVQLKIECECMVAAPSIEPRKLLHQQVSLCSTMGLSASLCLSLQLDVSS